MPAPPDPLNALLCTIDSLLEGRGSSGDVTLAARDFVESGWLARHFSSTAARVLASIRGKNPMALDLGNAVTLFDEDAAAGGRRLALQTGFFPPPFLIATADITVYIPFQAMRVDHYRIEAPAGVDVLSQPGAVQSLTPLGSRAHAAYEPLVKTNMRDIIAIAEDSDLVSLIFARTVERQSYQLVFDPKDHHFLGTSLVDVASSKAITLLEILEETRSPLLARAALDYCDHYSPIVRWRALSSLNKIHHEKVGDILTRFCDDQTQFIAQAARQALASARPQTPGQSSLPVRTASS